MLCAPETGSPYRLNNHRLSELRRIDFVNRPPIVDSPKTLRRGCRCAGFKLSRGRMTDSPQYDVAIVGLGPVGAVAANLCGQAGLRTLVIERGAVPYTLPRAIHLDAEVMRIFQSIGLDGQVATMTRPLGGSVYLGCDGRPIRRFRGQDTRDTLGWPASNLFYQPRLEEALRHGLERFANVTVKLQHELHAIRQHEDEVELTLSPVGGGENLSIKARYVLACDGASSPVRKQLGIPLDSMAFEERWLVIDAMVNGPMRWPNAYEIPPEVRSGDYSLMVCDPARPATIIPGSGKHRRWEYMLLPHESDEAAQAPEHISQLLSAWIDPHSVNVVRSAVYRFRGLIAHNWRKGNVFLLGDAAHQTPPFFGQGMCHGMRDAAQLVWKLRMVLQRTTGDTLLDTYQQEREGHVRAVIKASITAGAAVCILDPEKAAARDKQFRAEEEARGGVTVAMTDVVPPIRDGVIDARTGGERLPQPPIMGSNGHYIRLDDILGDRFALLTFDTPEIKFPPKISASWTAIEGQSIQITSGNSGNVNPGTFCDTSGALGRWATDRKAQFVLVRPDRYVFGTAASAAEVEALLSHLSEKLHWRSASERRAVPASHILEASSP